MEMLGPIMNQLLFLFTCIIIGIILKKTNKLADNAANVLSKLENEIIIPAFIISSFSANCTIGSLSENVSLILWGLFFTLLQISLSLVLTPLFTKDKSIAGIYKYSLAVVNFAFMGNSLVLGLFGSEMLFKYLMFSLPIQITIFSLGVIWLTAGKEKFTIKRLINPTTISMVIGILMGIANVKLPTFGNNVLSSLSNCFSPIAMILTGLVIGSFDFGKLFGDRKIYILTIVRCVLIPMAILVASNLAGVDPTVQTLLIFITAMPLGLNTIVFPSAYGGDTTPGASMAVISNIAGLVTVPLFLMMFL